MSETPDWASQITDPKLRFDPDAVVRSERIEIDAPAERVWAILTDLPQYGAWNPFCIAAESTLEMGAPVVMRLKSYVDPGEIVPNTEFVCAFEPSRLLSWQLPWSEAWPYPARRDQIIEPLGEGRCAYHSIDAFLGDNGIHVMRFAGSWVKRAFDDTARALKARAEAR
jgi:hypothetical protein